jgi:hypothetical protein
MVGRDGTLSKKHRCKRYERAPQPASKLYFSLATARLLKDALGFFEMVLACEPENLPNLPFAKQVVSELKTKLDDMLQREEWEKETPLDYNEVHLLYTCCAMYLIELKCAHRYDLLPPCIKLYKQLALVVEHVNKETAHLRRK